MAKRYDCWIKPPNEDWFNYTERNPSYYVNNGGDLQRDYEVERYVPIEYLRMRGISSRDFFSLGHKIQWRPRKDKKWRAREEKRMSRIDRKDMYELLPKEWNDLATITEHYAHLSNDRDGDNNELIAYTMSPEKGEQDVQTKIKAGRYLKKYYPHLGNDQIRYYSEAVKALYNEVSMTDDARLAALIYENGPNSCMKRDADHFDYPEHLIEQGIVHPVAAYFAGDFKLAWIGSKEAPTARCLVWPERKLFGRIYGAVDRMKHTLCSMGYEEDYNVSTRTFAGAKMKIIYTDDNYIVWPYVDGCEEWFACKEERDVLYFGPRTMLDKGRRWYVAKDVNNSEGGICSYNDPFMMRCAITNKIIRDELLGCKDVIGRISEDQYVYITVLKKKGYVLLEGEEFWLAPAQVAYLLEGGKTTFINRKTTIEGRGYVYLRIKGNYELYAPKSECVCLASGLWVHYSEAQEIVEYEGFKYRNLKELFADKPNLDPGMTLFELPLSHSENSAVKRHLYNGYSRKTILNTLLPNSQATALTNKYCAEHLS